MSNYIVTEIALKKHHYNDVLKNLASEHGAFDLNLAVPAPKSLPEFNQKVLLAFAHHVIALDLELAEMDQIAESLDNYLEDADVLYDLAHEFAELLNNADPKTASQLLQVGLTAYNNFLQYEAISASDWKNMVWGVDSVEAVEVKGRNIRLYTRSSVIGFVMAWSRLAQLDLSVSVIDSGCHHSMVAEYKRGKCTLVHRDRKQDLRTLAQSLLGYTKAGLI